MQPPPDLEGLASKERAVLEAIERLAKEWLVADGGCNVGVERKRSGGSRLSKTGMGFDGLDRDRSVTLLRQRSNSGEARRKLSKGSVFAGARKVTDDGLQTTNLLKPRLISNKTDGKVTKKGKKGDSFFTQL